MLIELRFDVVRVSRLPRCRVRGRGRGGTERLSALLDALATSFSVACLKLELEFSMVEEQCSKVGEFPVEDRSIEETILETSRREKEGSGDLFRDVVHAHEEMVRRDAGVFAT